MDPFDLEKSYAWLLWSALLALIGILFTVVGLFGLATGEGVAEGNIYVELLIFVAGIVAWIFFYRTRSRYLQLKDEEYNLPKY